MFNDSSLRDLTMTGGYVFARSTGNNGIDTNGNCYIKGGLENGASISGGTAKQTTSWSANTWYALYNGSTLVGAFKTPASSGQSYGPGGPGGGGPGGW